MHGCGNDAKPICEYDIIALMDNSLRHCQILASSPADASHYE